MNPITGTGCYIRAALCSPWCHSWILDLNQSSFINVPFLSKTLVRVIELIFDSQINKTILYMLGLVFSVLDSLITVSCGGQTLIFDLILTNCALIWDFYLCLYFFHKIPVSRSHWIFNYPFGSSF
jgi:hypothetical protein